MSSTNPTPHVSRSPSGDQSPGNVIFPKIADYNLLVPTVHSSPASPSQLLSCHSPSKSEVPQAIQAQEELPNHAPTDLIGISEEDIEEYPPIVTSIKRIILKTGKRRVQDMGDETRSRRHPYPSPTSVHHKTSRNLKKTVPKPRKRRGSFSSSSTESDDYTQEGVQTKSGRKIVSPTTLRKETIMAAQNRLEHQASVPLGQQEDRRDEAVLYTPRQLEPDAVDANCLICHRSPDTLDNQIVFCDGCDAPYHQKCHSPEIDNSFIESPESMWFCRSCARANANTNTSDSTSTSRWTNPSLSTSDKIRYLSSLSHDDLVSLVMFCERQAPEIQIFPSNAAEIIERLQTGFSASDPSRRRISGNISQIERSQEPQGCNKGGNDDDRSLWQDDQDNPGLSHYVYGLPEDDGNFDSSHTALATA